MLYNYYPFIQNERKGLIEQRKKGLLVVFILKCYFYHHFMTFQRVKNHLYHSVK